jgi:hypothetical protein
MDKKIRARISRILGIEDISEKLARLLKTPDLQSLLMSVFRQRTRNLQLNKVYNDYRQNRFVKPSEIDPLVSMKFDLLVISILSNDFQPINLSPVCPFGSCSTMAPLNQDWIMTTIRNTEIVADATNVLALESAARRREFLIDNSVSKSLIKLCCSHRHIRMQPFHDGKFSSHFKVICLTSAGRDEGSFKFEIENLYEHLEYYLCLLTILLENLQWDPKVTVYLTDLQANKTDLLQKMVISPLKEKYPSVKFTFTQQRQSGMNYYQNIAFNIGILDNTGKAYDYVVDGGFTDWTQKLLNNRKERFLTSAVGSDLLLRIIGFDTSRELFLTTKLFKYLSEQKC